MESFKLPFVAIEEYCKDNKNKHLKRAFEHVTKFASLGEFVAEMEEHAPHGVNSWYGGDATVDLAQCVTGNLAQVPKSDLLMSKFEHLLSYTSSKFVTVDDIAGGVPNVPAFLACSPLNMRRRQRQASELGPLTICVDLTSSAGIHHEVMVKRSIAVLALVRVMASRRPVTLWAGGCLSMDCDGAMGGASCWVNLDTAPMDLARVAHFLTSVPTVRGTIYSWLKAKRKAGGGWQWGDVNIERNTSQRSLARHMSGEVLYLGPPYLSDDVISNPEKWLLDTIEKYSKPAEI